ncbi:MAG: ribosomal protein small subunit ribosomal protein [Candidatus Parcubacteria bacterium]|jgi:small subunit ribosomal protein S2
MKSVNTDNKKAIESMLSVGAHFGYAKSRRHPSTKSYIAGSKNGYEIIDLEKTADHLEKALAFVSDIAKDRGQVLFVSTKKEFASIIKDAALSIDQPYVIGRWLGGTLTNFEEITKRVKRLESLLEQKAKGLLAKYTKKERLLIDREIEDLEERFGGITNMKFKPKAVFVIDSKHEDIAVQEALREKISVVGVANSDCDIDTLTYPIIANDSSVKSVKFFVGQIVDAYKNSKVEKRA